MPKGKSVGRRWPAAPKQQRTPALHVLLAAEMEILQAGKQVPAEGHDDSQPDLSKARKALAIAGSRSCKQRNARRTKP